MTILSHKHINMSYQNVFFKRTYFVVLVIFMLAMNFILPSSSVFATNVDVNTATDYTWDSQSDFSNGSADSNTDLSFSAGNVRLKATANAFTETTKETFESGTLSNVYPVDNSGGEVELASDSFNYTSTSTPAIASNSTVHSFVDSTNNLLYISTGQGLSVINQNGTTSFSDDTIIDTYSTASTPSIVDNYVKYSFLDTTNDLLYVATGLGLSVINRNSTPTNIADDTVYTYNGSSTPAIATNAVNNNLAFDSTNDLVYVPTNSGLSVINRNGTPTNMADDTVYTYTTASTPAIANNTVYRVSLNSNDDLVYVATSGGLSVINRNSTPTNMADDTVYTYTTASTPAIANNSATHVWRHSSGLLYISTGAGLSVINTQSTVAMGDDTLVITYSNSSTPALPFTLDNWIRHSWLDTDGLLYIGNQTEGLVVLDTNNTLTNTADDTIARVYRTASFEETALLANRIYYSWRDTVNNILYIHNYKTDGGLTAIKLDEYESSGTHTSQDLYLSSVPGAMIAWDDTTTGDHTVSMQTRTGTRTVLWEDHFNDGLTANISDEDGAGFTATESGGVLTISNAGSDDTYVGVDTGQVADYYPAGTVIRARIRMNTDTLDYYDGTGGFYFYVDAWNDDYSLDNSINRWVVVSFTSTEDFSKLILNPYQFDITVDTLEVDWVRVESPTTTWGSWSTACTTSTGCEITDSSGKNVLQYKTTLATSNVSTTPVINSVTLTDYQSSGVYTSDNLVFSHPVSLSNMSVTSTTPSNTTLNIQYSLNDGNTWHDAGDNISSYNFPISTPTSFKYKATLSTTDTSSTPVLGALTVNFSGPVSGPGTSGGTTPVLDCTDFNFTNITPVANSTITSLDTISFQTPDNTDTTTLTVTVEGETVATTIEEDSETGIYTVTADTSSLDLSLGEVSITLSAESTDGCTTSSSYTVTLSDTATNENLNTNNGTEDNTGNNNENINLNTNSEIEENTCSFSDVLETEWYYPFVQELCNLSIITGYPDGSFGGANFTNRAEISAMIFRAFAIQMSEEYNAPFSDIIGDEWFALYVDSLYNNDITNGYEDGTFRPGVNVTRAEALKMLLIAGGIEVPEITETLFPDVSVDEWYAKYIAKAVELGIVEGYEDGTFKPNNPINRAEISKIINKVLELL